MEYKGHVVLNTQNNIKEIAPGDNYGYTIEHILDCCECCLVECFDLA